MHPALAATLVLVGSAASTVLVLWIYRLEERHRADPKLWVAIMIWFLLCYGAFAFLVRPH